MGYEIERKYLIRKCDLPKDYTKYPYEIIEQNFLSLKPCIRVRKIEYVDEKGREEVKYIFTIKSKPDKTVFAENIDNDLVRDEREMEIPKSAYDVLKKKSEGYVIKKKRYKMPYKKWTIELDEFIDVFKGLYYAEVEFTNVDEANTFIKPDWFYKDVTGIDKYKNTSLSVCRDVGGLVNY